jgi:hypothetical protein
MSEDSPETQNRAERVPDPSLGAKIKTKMPTTPKSSNSKNPETLLKLDQTSRRMPNLARHLLDQAKLTPQILK